MSPTKPLPQADASKSNVSKTAASRSISSSSLLEGAKEILIQHADQIYRLRETRSGKLIMHK